MVSAAKIFTIETDLTLKVAAQKLKNFKKVEETETNQEKIDLVKEIKELVLQKNFLRGIFSYDYLITLSFKGEKRNVPVTKQTPFLMIEEGRKIFLIVLEKKLKANNVANQIREILLVPTGGLVEAKIPHNTLKTIHESNPESTKVIFFDEVDIPNVNKLSLYGPSLADCSLYMEYLKHGKIWYVVFEDKPNNLVVGLTRNGIVTVFTKITQEQFINYIVKEILPLIGKKEKQ